jgi:hypothetical protein
MTIIKKQHIPQMNNVGHFGDYIKHDINDVKLSLMNNDPIEENLHVVMAVSNPCDYKRRYALTKEFINRMENEENVILYVVELVYGDQPFVITIPENPRHLQIKGEVPIWHKENMLNIGMEKLLPPDWKAAAWVDADVDFENPYWALEALKLLNGKFDIIQLFSHAVDMDANEDSMNVFPGFGYQYTKKRAYTRVGINRMWHPGYAWALTRKAYEKMGGLYEYSILGSGDHNISLAVVRNGGLSLNKNVARDYLDSVLAFQFRVKNLRFGYSPGVVRHFFHGHKKNRKYVERWMILVKHNFSPYLHIKRNEDGLLVPTEECPQALLDEIANYFAERNEDEGFAERVSQLKM